VNTPEDQSHDKDSITPDKTTDMKPDSGSSTGSEISPAKIGPYVIKRVIASGGMGTVYEAMQENPRRPAAVKVVKRSMASGDALRRFEREAQALARLRHPGIAQIYEAGTYEEAGVSLPFFALEYIPNAKTIIEFAKSKNFGIREKLDLFLQVCEAVHYGHQRGIIHRDLKPGNILVDSEARVRIIDFGVARAVDADMEQADLQTKVGQIIGTAQYMSPEQFEGDPNDLDTRSDVYALGVVLYELLAGKLPYNIEHSGVFEVARIIREEQPAALGEAVSGIGSEVELMTAKALEKERERRYQSAFGLGADIRSFLKGEAISAKPTSLSYQVRVLARKNKAVVGLAVLAVVFLVVGIITTTGFYVDVRAEREKSEIAARKALAANEFLVGTLSAIVPYGYGDVKTIGDLCNRVSLDIDDAFPDNQAVEADVRNLIGKMYSRLDNRIQAEQQLRKAYLLRRNNLGKTHELSLQALLDLNEFYNVYGPPEKNVETSESYFEIISEFLGPDHDKTLEARDLLLSALYVAGHFNRAEKLAREYHLAVVKRFGKESEEAIDAKQTYGEFLLLNGNLTSARTSAKEVYELVLNLPEGNNFSESSARNDYAAALVSLGELDEAKQLYGHQKAPDAVGVELEYQGTIGNLNETVKVLVFFETWCPFSQRYIPKMETINRQYRGMNVDVLGLTEVNRSSSDDGVRQFILDNHVSFSVLKDNGRSANYFDVQGVPYTVILHEGEVVWKSSGAVMTTRRLVEGIVNAN
jgi:serine/threonine protein kinase/thiol-disulfide isomerase/thioredoxin